MEFRKALKFLVTAYYSKRMQVKMSKVERCIEQVPVSHCPLPLSCTWMTLHSPSSNVWHQIIQSAASQEIQRSLGVQGFHWGSVTEAENAHGNDFTTQFPAPRGPADSVWPKAPSVNHTVSINYLADSKTPGKQDILIKQDISRAQGLPPRNWSRASPLFWMNRVWTPQACSVNPLPPTPLAQTSTLVQVTTLPAGRAECRNVVYLG